MTSNLQAADLYRAFIERSDYGTRQQVWSIAAELRRLGFKGFVSFIIETDLSETYWEISVPGSLLLDLYSLQRLREEPYMFHFLLINRRFVPPEIIFAALIKEALDAVLPEPVPACKIERYGALRLRNDGDVLWHQEFKAYFPLAGQPLSANFQVVV